MGRGFGYNGPRGFGGMGRGLVARHALFPFGGIGMLVLIVVTLIVAAVSFWMLFRKAGFEGALGLLMLVPGVNLAVMLFLALADWPVLRELRDRRAADGVETRPDDPAWHGHGHVAWVQTPAPAAAAPAAAPASEAAPAAPSPAAEPAAGDVPADQRDTESLPPSGE